MICIIPCFNLCSLHAARWYCTVVNLRPYNLRPNPSCSPWQHLLIMKGYNSFLFWDIRLIFLNSCPGQIFFLSPCRPFSITRANALTGIGKYSTALNPLFCSVNSQLLDCFHSVNYWYNPMLICPIFFNFRYPLYQWICTS